MALYVQHLDSTFFDAKQDAQGEFAKHQLMKRQAEQSAFGCNRMVANGQSDDFIPDRAEPQICCSPIFGQCGQVCGTQLILGVRGQGDGRLCRRCRTPLESLVDRLLAADFHNDLAVRLAGVLAHFGVSSIASKKVRASDVSPASAWSRLRRSPSNFSRLST